MRQTRALHSYDSRRTVFMRNLLQGLRTDPLGLVGVLITGIILLAVTLAPIIATRDPNQMDLASRLQPPNREHWFGTDEAGRDLFSRLVYGCRLSVPTGFLILLVSSVVGSTLGAAAGFFGGLIDEVIMRISDFFMAFPYLILAMAIAFSLGASMQNAIFALIIVYWPSYARLIRGQVISLRQREFVEAARVNGAGNSRIILRHILPLTWSSLVIQFSLDMGFAIVALASLGFIGLGAQPPTPEWGTIIAQSRAFALDNWWYGVIPGVTISLAVIGFNLLGDFVQQLVEPSLRQR